MANTQQFEDVVSAAEAVTANYGHAAGIAKLRELSLEDFAALMWRLPLDGRPALSGTFPSAPSEDTQLLWTGAFGERLVGETCAFIRSVLGARFAGNALPYSEDVLDYGCGYGRMLRILPYYFPEQHIYGCDPWDESLNRCAQDRVPGQVALSDWIPDDLPFADGKFGLIYAFSVFTHLPDVVAKRCLATLRRKIAGDGLLAITIRSEAFWQAVSHLGEQDNSMLLQRHKATGYAFLPQANMQPVDGIITYGDTTMTIDFLKTLAVGWEVQGTAWNAIDPQQTIVLLKPC